MAYVKPSRLLILRGVGMTLVALLQWQIVEIPRLGPWSFDRHAVELERTRAWRYGYVEQHHGAVLVKTPLTADAPALRAVRSDDGLAAVMTRELRGLWAAAIVELLFYAALWGLVGRVLPRARWARLGSGSRRWRAAMGAGLSTVVFVTVAMAPYLLVGYGEPLFSNRIGPGGLSSTSLVPMTGAVRSAVSYGMLLEALLLWPMIAGAWAAESLSAFVGIRGSLWLVACLFWGAGAGLLAILVGPNHSPKTMP